MPSPADVAFNAVRSVLPKQRPIALHEPTFTGAEWTYVKDCLDSGWVSSVGSYVDRFEANLAAFCEVKHAIAIVNGTSALHLALLAAGVAVGDEVLVPAFTFVATTNAVSYCKAVPHFVDIDAASLGVDPLRLLAHLQSTCLVSEEGCMNRASGRRVRALIVMHTFGLPARMEELSRVCDEWKLELVEDAAEALGSRLGFRHVGHYGVCAALSFNGNKIVTTGGGGALLTDDTALARHLKHLSTTARVPSGWNFLHDEVGYNYRLPNLNAALGCAQLETLSDLLRRKRLVFEAYAEALSNMEGVRVVHERQGTASNFWLVALQFDAPADRDAFLALCAANGIQSRPPWAPMHRLPMYAECPRMELAVTEFMADRIANVPSSPSLMS